MFSTRPNYQEKTLAPSTPKLERQREVTLLAVFSGLFLALFGRFFYLQIAKGEEFEELSKTQHQQLITQTGERGRIFTSDDYLLVGNHFVYRLYITAAQAEAPSELYDQLAPLILADSEASASLKAKDLFLTQVEEKKNGKGIVALADKISQTTREHLEALNLTNLVFEKQLVRFYPEGDLAAQTVGFLSKAEGENDVRVGHYGIEGGLNKELAGKMTQVVSDVDVYKNPIFLNSDLLENNLDGRDIYLTIRRDLQILAQDVLNEDLAKFGAQAGEIIITDPKTGKILALATSPSYDPDHYYQYDTRLYKNPAVVDLFEPGSTFKVLTMAAGIDAGVISPDTPCERCSGPRQVADSVIKTWNNSYNPGITMTQALQKSDNTALVYVSDLLDAKRFREYLERFYIGKPLGLEIEEDISANFPEVWGPVETATRAFGQGVSLTSLQLIRAVGAIANEGKMMKPYLVERAIDQSTGTVYETEPEVLGQVISPATATAVSQMMQAAMQHGEAQYLYKNTTLIAGKTGTAQIPEAGGYSSETIASLIGFAPYNDPKFLMFIKYLRPRSSIYAAETAALTWNRLAEKLFLIFNISLPPEPTASQE